MNAFTSPGTAPFGGGFGQASTNATAPTTGFGGFGQNNAGTGSAAPTSFGQAPAQAAGAAAVPGSGFGGAASSAAGFGTAGQATNNTTKPQPAFGQSTPLPGGTSTAGGFGGSTAPIGVGLPAAGLGAAAQPSPATSFGGFGSGAKASLNPFATGTAQPPVSTTPGNALGAPGAVTFSAATNLTGQPSANGATQSGVAANAGVSAGGNSATHPAAGSVAAGAPTPNTDGGLSEPDSKKTKAQSPFGGFGGVSTTSGTNKTPAAASFAGFGGTTSAPTNPTTAGTTTDTPTPSGGLLNATAKPPEASSITAATGTSTGGLGFGSSSVSTAASKNQSVPTTGIVNTNATTAVAGNQTSSELKGKVLSTILAQFDKAFSKDYRDFSELSQLMMLRDRQIVERGDEILSHMTHLDEVIATADATRQALLELKNKQATIGTMLQRFEDAVQPVFSKVRPSFTNVDEAREKTYTAVINLFDEVETLKLRLQQSVRQHNGSLRQLRQSDDLAKVVGLIDCQLGAMEACAAQAEELEREVDLLLGKSTNV